MKPCSNCQQAQARAQTPNRSMQGSFFNLSPETPRLQPMVIDQSVEALFERIFGLSAEDAADEALWASNFSGPLSQRLNLRDSLVKKLLWELRNNETFQADMTSGVDRRGNLRRQLQRWIRQGR